MYPFSIKTFVYTRPNLRNQEMELYIGMGFCQRLFDTEEEMKDVFVKLVYPERWINIPEQRNLFKAITLRCKKMREIELITHSTILISETPNGSTHIMDDCKDYPAVEYRLGVRYCSE